MNAVKATGVGNQVFFAPKGDKRLTMNLRQDLHKRHKMLAVERDTAIKNDCCDNPSSAAVAFHFPFPLCLLFDFPAGVFGCLFKLRNLAETV